MATPPDRNGGPSADGTWRHEPTTGNGATDDEDRLTVSAEDSSDLAFSLVAALGGTPEQVARLRTARDSRMRATWARFALRAAGEALLRADVVRLRLAMAAAALSATDRDDSRDLMVQWAPLHHVATVLGTEPGAVFDEAARLAEPGVADRLRSFGQRSDVTLVACGWRHAEQRNGPVFVPDR